MHGLLSLHVVHTHRQPRRRSQLSVLHAKSVQLSTLQYTEQPSQLFGVPGVSHDSGNSTAPFPHVGHGTMQAGWDQFVQTGNEVIVGAGAMAPVMDGGFGTGWWMKFWPS